MLAVALVVPAPVPFWRGPGCRQPLSGISSSAVAASSSSGALQVLASTALAMLSSSEVERTELVRCAKESKHIVETLLHEFDASGTGQLETPEAEALFAALARQLLQEAATASTGAAAAHARELLVAEDACGVRDGELSAIDEMAGHLLRIADADGDGIVSLQELAALFEGPLIGVSDESL